MPVARRDGVIDSQQAYARHVYDFVTDTPYVHLADRRRLDFLFGRQEETAKRLAVPLVVGEWGAFGEAPRAESAAGRCQRHLERLRCGDWYWHYRPKMSAYSAFPAVCRGDPLAVAGVLRRYAYDPRHGRLTMAWEEDADARAPTLVYLPERSLVEGERILLTPAAPMPRLRPVGTGPGMILEIPPAGGGWRELAVGEG